LKLFKVIKKTLMERACAEVPGFDGLYRQLLTNIRLNGQSESTPTIAS